MQTLKKWSANEYALEVYIIVTLTKININEYVSHNFTNKQCQYVNKP